MEEKDLQELERLAIDLSEKSLRYLKKDDYYHYYKCLSINRAIDIYLDKWGLVKICDDCFDLSVEKGRLSEKDKKNWILYGIGKLNFLVGLMEKGRDYIEDNINPKR